MVLFLGIFNYVSKFSSGTAGVCKTLCKLISVKADWTWSKMYQDVYDRANMIVKKDACMKCYSTPRLLKLETDASGFSHGAKLLQIWDGINCRQDEVPDNATLHPIAFASQSLLSAE